MPLFLYQNMATQPVSGGQRFSIGTIGTNVIANQKATIQRVYWGGTYVGSVTLHDAASAAGTSATSPIITLGIPGAVLPSFIDIGVQCRFGIVSEATGTPVMTVVWDK